MKVTKTKVLALVGAAAMTAATIAAPSVDVVNIQQQYPWTNTVDITYTVQGVKTHQVDKILLTNETYFVAFEATDADGNAIPDTSGRTIITNALVNGPATEVVQWQPALGRQVANCTATPSVFRGEENAYLVINLETNALGKMEWWYEPMSTQEASNKRYNTVDFKTKYMVFRRVRGGEGVTYTIGHNKWKDPYNRKNTAHTARVPADYYYAVFPLTVGQYQRLIEGGDASSTSVTNQDRLLWTTVRYPTTVTIATVQGPLFNMSEATGLHIDLPTHAMHEVAIRAGSTTIYVGGDTTASNRRFSNGSMKSSLYDVGLFDANNWGFYGIVGPGKVMLLDSVAFTEGDLATYEKNIANVFIPILQGARTHRLLSNVKGEYALTDARQSPSSWTSYALNSTSVSGWGFRFAIYPEGYYPNGGQE